MKYLVLNQLQIIKITNKVIFFKIIIIFNNNNLAQNQIAKFVFQINKI